VLDGVVNAVVELLDSKDDDGGIDAICFEIGLQGCGGVRGAA
jgi:hypothetical protein